MALRRCPDLIFVRPRFELYRDVSRQVRAIFRSYTELVEPASIDEAYLDVTQTLKGPPSATLIARAIRQEIFEATRLTASAGVSFNKFLAKTASGMNKPDGLTVVLPEDADALLAALPIERFHGIGPATARRMGELGITRGADLLRFAEDELVGRFGRVGRYYYRIVRGLDERPVRIDYERKSLGAERTFEQDISDHVEMMRRLDGVADEVGRRMKPASIAGRTVTLKIKYHDFAVSTRSRTVRAGVRTAEELRAIGAELFRTPFPPTRAVRLLGLSISNLIGEEGEAPGGQLALPLV
jgi:DNA polymerase-4